MAETKDEPVFAVKLTGILRQEDIEKYARRFQEVLPGHVIVTDNRVEDIREVTGMRTQNAIVTVHHEGETEYAPAKVWPVAMSSDELLVEWEDGTLGAAKLWNIQIGRMK